MTPFFQILQGETDVTSRAGGGNISLNVTDGTGEAADTIDYQISDQDGVVSEPPTGVEVRVLGGYRERSPRFFGTFVVDEVALDGYPQTISVNGQSVGAKTAAKQPRSESFQAPDVSTYGDVIRKLAERNGLTASIAPEIASKAIDYEAQSEENDLAFLTRIGSRVGFDLTIKEKRLVVTPRGFGKSAGGLLLPIVDIVAGVNLISYSVSRQDRDRYGKVRASYFDRDAVEKKEVDVPSSKEGPEYLLRTPFRSEEEALDAARTKADDLRRGTATAEFRIAGNEQARAEAFVEVARVRSAVDGRWRAKQVTHAFTAGGTYETTVSCELPGGEGET